MAQNLGQRIRDWVYRPWLDWVQVEVTTACNARCIYCPTAVLGDAWPRRHMSLADFRRILPMLARSARPSPWVQPLLHLQGWGEPLLNPDFPAIVATAKRAGMRIGTTSNAMALDSETAARLIEAGVDVLSLSVAGVDERNDAIRRGTRLARVFEALAGLDHHKKQRGSATPSLHIAYMLLASGLGDVERIPETFAGRGVDQIVVSTLGFVAEETLRGEAIVARTEAEYEALDRRLGLVAAKAAGLDMELHYRIPPPPGRPPGLCAENVQAALVVTVDGKVTPCMFSRFDETPLAFGDLAGQSLSEIWWNESYLKFRRSFWDGTPPPRCLACDKLDRH
jgi:radical SAM protein with 4Fe4S-binding SPASM domain